MYCLIAKVKNRSRTITYRKIISERMIYQIPDNLTSSVEYNPSTLLEENQWYKFEHFSQTIYCQDILKNTFSSVNYDNLSRAEFNKIDYLCSYQEDVYYFQNVSKNNLQPKNLIHFGDSYEYVENGMFININRDADAIYIKNDDTLYFKNLSKISGIFRGISELYREATDEETENFLRNDFICLTDDYGTGDVKASNRKRIAMAVDTLSNFDEDDKERVFEYIRDYCPSLRSANNSFSIGNEDELKQLLWGIEQRYYTTPVGNKKRIANSIIPLST